MITWCRWPSGAIVIAAFVWITPFSEPLAAACAPPDPTKISVAYPQGTTAQIKLYETSKGVHIGSIKAALIMDQIELCSATLGRVNEIRLPGNAAIKLQKGKSKIASGKYWVRRNQIAFEELKNKGSKKVFECERNQVKTQFSSGAAGNEKCKPTQ